VVELGGSARSRVSDEEAGVVQQRNTSDKRAVADDDTVLAGGPVPDVGAPIAGGVGGIGGEDAQSLDVEPPPPVRLSWASPSTTGPASESAGLVKMRRRLSWGQVLIFLAGVAALVFGFGAVILGGLAGSVTAPVVQVFTYNHTPLLGLIETGVGVVLIVCALIPGGRWIAGPVGVAAIVGGALVIAQLDWIQVNLAAEKRFGWIPILVGSVAYVGAMVPTPKRVATAAPTAVE
jgi:hypothetical protein